MVALVLIWACLTVMTTAKPSSAATGPCGTGGNAIACENSKPGSPPSAWEIDGAGDEDIQGFSTDISVDAGSSIDFKIDTDASAYTITIFRMGWYDGDGARQIATVTPSAKLPQTQPNCITDVTTELTDCGNWGVSASWAVPSDAVSGVYIAHLYRPDNEHDSNITFVVRNDDSHSDVVFQTSDPTWEAYNDYGGSDFYQGAANGRAYKVSYNRPIMTRNTTGGQDFFMSNEYPLVRFLERNGYDLSYIAGVDTDRDGGLLLNHKVFLSVGHDEYWSGAQRANVVAARDAGVNLQFLSGNEMYWRTRYEPSADDSHTPYRTLVSYKESWSDAKIDPADEWTGTWRDPRFAPQSAGAGQPENAVTGTIFMSNYTDMPLTVTKAEGKLRLWRNTGLDSMTTASTALAPHTVGYESDEDQDNGFRPAGLIDLSTTTGPISGQYMQDYANTTADGTTTHSLTLYKAPSGALVFGAGTVQWTWGLDDYHDTPYDEEPADARMQQAQVNLLADMGAQPTTLMSGLVATTKSADTTGPTLSITSPDAGAAEANGAQVKVAGTAEDAGGGTVAGVEYSTDGGDSWHPAQGTSSWSFTYTQHGLGSVPLEVRAIDDSANVGTAVTRSFPVTCPCSVFGDAVPTTTPSSVVAAGTLSANDSGAVELGLRFTPSVDGFVTGVRFYKGDGNTGTHVGSLWSAGGEKLASVTFADETASGWQQATFASPVAVAAGVTYVVSYTAPAGHYVAQSWGFGEAGVDAHPLQVDGGYAGAPAGVYASPGMFPGLSFQKTNYYVDAMFTTTDDSPLVALSQWPTPGSSSVAASTSVSARLSKPVVASSVDLSLEDANGDSVAGSTTYDSSTRTVTFTPASELSGFVKYRASVSATDTQGNDVATGRTWSFTTATPQGPPGACPCSLFADTTVPTLLEAPDPNKVTLGVRFSSDVNGTITGVRFYKGVDNTGPHTGALWSSDGAQLAAGTFTDESTSGWQTLTFAEPVAVTKDTTYVASYTTDSGLYSATVNGFAPSGLSYGPLHAPSDAGAYYYGDGFPSTTTANSYLVDAVFQKRSPVLTVAGETPADGAVDVPRNAQVAITLSDPITSDYTMSVAVDGTPVPGSVDLSADGTVLTYTPDEPLPADTDVEASVSGLTGAEGGATLATQTWSFHTRGPDSETTRSLFGDVEPQSAAVEDSAPVELGTRFVPARDGEITGIRFFKGTGNGGSHVGHLWSADGQLLGTARFSGESATGWQQATLSPAVHVNAGTEYVVSYLAPRGHYAATGSFFNTDYSSGPLTAPGGSNGLYLYGAAGGFPTYSWGSTNYFVDVAFEPDAATLSVTGTSPEPDAVGVSRSVTPSITFSAAVAEGYTMSVAQDGAAVPGVVERSTDGTTLTFEPASPLPAGTAVTVSVSGVVSVDGATVPDRSWTFTTEATDETAISLFGAAVPAITDTGDADAVELGTAFTPSVDGVVTKIRFYKSAQNTGTHTGSIWSSSGERLASVTFADETESGWQEASLDTPLAIEAGETYVVSYYAPEGHYSASSWYFTSDHVHGPLTAPGGANGRYVYGADGGFPTGSLASTNYFVDVVFRSVG